MIATKDRPQYLQQAVQSVLEQESDIDELILVNDNSRLSEVEDICRRYAAHPKVKYVHLSGKGSSGTARNAGLKKITSEFVCFLDDDDAFLPGKIKEQLSLFRENPDASFIGTSAVVVDQDGNYCTRVGDPDFFPGAPAASMLAYCRLVHSSVMLRTSAIKEIGGYREHFEGEDWELWCRLLARGYRLHYVERPLTLYRRHGSNISNTQYVRKAVRNVLSEHLKSSEQVISPLPYHSTSGELVGVHPDRPRSLRGGHRGLER